MDYYHKLLWKEIAMLALCRGDIPAHTNFGAVSCAYINRKQRIACREPSNPAQSFGKHLVYLRNLQRFESQLGYPRYNVHGVHRRDNLPNTALNRVPDVALAVRLKYA